MLKRIILAVCFWMLALPAWGQTRVETQWYSYNGSSSGGSCSSGTVTLTFGTATTAGELIYIAATENTSGNLGTVSDSGSQSYTLDNSGTALQGGHYAIGTWYFFNSASGITYVTFTPNASDNSCQKVMASATHYKGIVTTGAHDVSENNFTGSLQASPWSSTAVSTTNANDFLIGIDYYIGTDTSQTWAATGSWTLRTPASTASWFDNNEGTSFAYEDLSVTATGNYQATGTNTASGTVNAAAFSSFKVAPTQASSPTFSPAAGTYPPGQKVTMITTLGTVICYNTTGTPATNGDGATCAAGSTIYFGPITVASTETLYAVAGSSGLTDSSVTSGTYTVVPGTVTGAGNIAGSGVIN